MIKPNKPIKPITVKCLDGKERLFIFHECEKWYSDSITEEAEWENGRKVSVKYYMWDYENENTTIEIEVYIDEKEAKRVVRKLQRAGFKWEYFNKEDYGKEACSTRYISTFVSGVGHIRADGNVYGQGVSA